MSFRTLLVLFFGLCMSGFLAAQYTPNDTLSKKEWKAIQKGEKEPFYPKPGKAALYSAIFPGGGQLYNRSYWKLPIVYGGVALFYYFIDVNSKTYRKFNDALVQRTDGDDTTIDRYSQTLSENDLIRLRDQYQKQLEMSIIGTSIFYLVTIGDAFTDAHLKEFDISDDLSLNVEPSHLRVGTTNAIGVSLSFNFK